MFSRADAYERYMGRWSRLLAPQVVAFADIRDGDAVLDVGAGTGVLSLAVRDANPSGVIVGIDPSADYVAYAAHHSRDASITFEVGDARELPAPDARFDKVVSMLVLNFVPEPARAVTEMMRVTRPGGTVAAVTWDYAAGMEMLRVFWDEAIASDPAIEPRDEGHMPLCKAGELARLWTAQGLDDVQEQPLTAVLPFASFDDYWAPFLLGQGPAGAYAAGLPADRRDALAARLRRRVLGERPDQPFEMRARAWAVKGKIR